MLQDNQDRLNSLLGLTGDGDEGEEPQIDLTSRLNELLELPDESGSVTETPVQETPAPSIAQPQTQPQPQPQLQVQDPTSRLNDLLGVETQREEVSTLPEYIAPFGSFLRGGLTIGANAYELADAIAAPSVPGLAHQGVAYKYISGKLRDFANRIPRSAAQINFTSGMADQVQEPSSFFTNMVGQPEEGSEMSWAYEAAKIFDTAVTDVQKFFGAASEDPEGAALYLLNAVAETAPTLIVTIGAAIATGGQSIPVQIGAMAVAGSALEAGGALADLRFDSETGERLVSTAEQDLIAIGGGIVAGSFEALGAGAILGNAKTLMAKAALNDAAKDTFMRTFGKNLTKYVKSGVAEGSTEVIQDLILDAAAKIGWDPERDLGEDWFTSFAVGAILGSGVTAVTSNVEAARDRIAVDEPTLFPNVTPDKAKLTALGYPAEQVSQMTPEQVREAADRGERNQLDDSFSLTEADVEAVKAAVSVISAMPESSVKEELKRELNESIDLLGIKGFLRNEFRRDLEELARDDSGRVIYTAEEFIQLEHEGMSRIDRQAAGLNDIQIPEEVANLPVVGIAGYGLDFLALELSGGSVLKLAKPGRGVLPPDAGKRSFDMPIIAQGEGWHIQPLAEMTTTKDQRDLLDMMIRDEGYRIVDGGQSQVGLITVSVAGEVKKKPVLIDYGAVERDPNAPRKATPPNPEDSPEATSTGQVRNVPYDDQVVDNPETVNLFDDLLYGRSEAEGSDLASLGFSAASLNQLRTILNLNPIDDTGTKTWPMTLSRAVEKRLHENAEMRAQMVVEGKMTADDDMLAGFTLRLSEVVVQFEQHQAAVEAALQEGDGIQAAISQNIADSFKAAADVLSQAIRMSRTTHARALGMGRMVLDAYAYTELGALEAFQKVTGVQPTAEQRENVQKSVEAIREAQAEVDAAQVANDEAYEAEVSAMAQEVVREQSKAVEDSAKLSKERQEILAALAKLGFKLHSLAGVSPEALWQLSRLAVSYIKGGAHTLEQVVSQMRDTIPSLTEMDVYEILTAQNPKVKKRVQTENQRIERSLKTQSRLMIQLEKAAQGIFEEKKPRRRTDPKIKVLRDRLRALEKEARKTETDLKRLDTMVHKIRELEDLLNLDSIPVSNIEAAKTRLSELRSIARIEKKYQEIYDRIVRGDTTPNTPTPRKPKSAQLRKAELKLEMAKRELDALIEAAKPLTFFDFKRAGDSNIDAAIKSTRELATELNSFMRTMMATADVSFLGLQMLYLGAGHPIEFTRAGIRGIAAAFNATKSFEINMALRDPSNPLSAMMMRDGLDITSSDAGPISQREEVFMSRILQRMPTSARVVLGGAVGGIIGGPAGAAVGAASGVVMPTIARASDRAFVTSSNLLRAGLYAQMARRYGGDVNAMRAYAKYLNEMTGRAKINSATAKTLSLAFFAPRFSYSMFKSPFTMVSIFARQPKLRRAFARDLGSFLAIGSAVLAIAKMNDLEVGDDPRDSDWGKIVIGNTRIDIWAGRAQVARTLLRGAIAYSDKKGWTGQHLEDWQKEVDLYRFFADVMIYKSAPLPSLIVTGLTGRDVVGEEREFSEAAAMNLVPLFAQDMMEAYQYDMNQFALSSLAFTGVRASAYGGPLQSGDIKPILRGAGFRPREPDYPERIANDPEMKEFFKDMYQDKFAMRVRLARHTLEGMTKEQRQQFLRYYAAVARYETSLAMGNVPLNYPTFTP